MGESAELFEMTGRARQFGGHPAKLVGQELRYSGT